jgi:hypothetical protein
MSTPVRLVVEYEDGSKKEVSFSKLNGQTRNELAKLGLCSTSCGIGPARQYALLNWKDGWQEVIGIDRNMADLLRYYVVQRIEDRGRLSFDVGADFPELFVIRRTPRELNSLLIVDDKGIKSYPLDSEVERWEGIFQAGGKKEYVKYDKTDSAYPQKVVTSMDGLTKILDAVKKKLNEKGLKSQDVLGSSEEKRIELYKELAKETGLKAYERQEDVYGFIEKVMAAC